MGNMYGKGPKGTATKKHSAVVRLRGECEASGYRSDCQRDHALQAAHINSRRYNSTRTLLNNAFCLCASCHKFFTDFPREFSRFISTTWAQDIYENLTDLSIRSTMFKMKDADWREENDRLNKMAELDPDQARMVEYAWLCEKYGWPEEY